MDQASTKKRAETIRVALTIPRIETLKCPADKSQTFIWDAATTGLGVRKTQNGKPAFIFGGYFAGEAFRIALGYYGDWTIAQAREKARELQREIDQGRDPRNLKRQEEAEAAMEAAQGSSVRAVWEVYLADRKPYWGSRHYEDHVAMTRSGGKATKRGTRGRGKTIAGPLHALMDRPLRKLDAATLEHWAAEEAKTRPSQARLALRCFKSFLNWCAEHAEYQHALPNGNVAVSRKTREVLGRDGVKQDALLKEQLPAWFGAICALRNPVHSAYLQTLLLTGARPGEVVLIRWEDIDLQWRTLRIRDKVEGERKIPLTPYVSQLFQALPRSTENTYVFASAISKPGHMREPNLTHTDACKAAGIDHLTLHGLRRSFKSLTEWLAIPAGVVAQIMGHKPSATVERHYTVRPLDLLRVHHERIEKWILEQAGVNLPEQQ
jgi:integrase